MALCRYEEANFQATSQPPLKRGDVPECGDGIRASERCNGRGNKIEKEGRSWLGKKREKEKMKAE